MRRIALLTVPLLLLGLIALPVAAQEYENYGVSGFQSEGTTTIIESSKPDAEPVMEEHTHDMGTPDDADDDVTHTHSITHNHEYEKKMMMEEGDDMMMGTIAHDHTIADHTHNAYVAECGFGRCVAIWHHTHPLEVHSHGEGDDEVQHDHLGGLVYHTHADTTGVFQESAAGIQLKGSTSVTFGINLNTNATGFRNETTADLQFSFPERSTDRKGKALGQISAEITLKDFQYTVDSDGGTNTTAPEIDAKVNVGETFSITTFKTVGIDYVNKDAGGKTAIDLKGAGGLEVGYQIAPVILKIGVISRGDWVDDDPPAAEITHDADGNHVITPVMDTDDGNVDNAYAFLGTFGLDVGDQDESSDPDDIEIKFSYPHEYPEGEDQIGIGAKAAFDLGDVEPSIMFDGQIPSGDEGIPWDVGGGLTWNLVGKSSFAATMAMHIPAAGESTVGAKVTLIEKEERNADGTAKAGEDGGLHGLGATLAFSLIDLTSDSNTWDLKVEAFYWDPNGEIKPYFEVGIDSAGQKLPFKAGLELRVIDLVTTTFEYASTDLIGDDSDKGAVTVGMVVGY